MASHYKTGETLPRHYYDKVEVGVRFKVRVSVRVSVTPIHQGRA